MPRRGRAFRRAKKPSARFPAAPAWRCAMRIDGKDTKPDRRRDPANVDARRPKVAPSRRPTRIPTNVTTNVLSCNGHAYCLRHWQAAGPHRKPIASSSMEIPKPAKAAVRSVVNADFSAFFLLFKRFLEHVDRHAEQNDPAHNDCGRLEPRPDAATDQQTDERHYGFEEGEGRRRAKQAHAAQPEQHSDGESVEPERDDKNGDLEKHGLAFRKGASQSGRTLRAVRVSPPESPSCRAAGAAMARFYRIELRRLSFRRSALSRLMRHLDGQVRQRREAGETAPMNSPASRGFAVMTETIAPRWPGPKRQRWRDRRAGRHRPQRLVSVCLAMLWSGFMSSKIAPVSRIRP